MTDLNRRLNVCKPTVPSFRYARRERTSREGAGRDREGEREGVCGDARAGYIHTRYIGAVPKFSKIVFCNDHPSRWDVCSVANDHVRKRRLAGPAREMAKTQMRDRSARLLIFRHTYLGTYLPTYIHTYIYTYMHIYIHTYI